jgi:electron transport complex protein RnfD
MRMVILATIPGIVALSTVFGMGVLVNLLIASLTALVSEAIILKLTAVLLAISLPPYAPWWVVVVGTSFAIIIAKQLYGGLGFNPFNPAMAAYVVLLISLPVQMTSWGAPFSDNYMGFADSLAANLNGSVDAITSATPLDALKLGIDAHTKGHVGGYGWEWVNAGFLLGGLYLLSRKIFTYHAPIGMLISLGIMAFLFPHETLSRLDSLMFHWFTGATMFGAFFIITDPVSSATSNRGRLVFGAAIGIILYCIRQWGNYPDAVAFAVLLLNLAAPFIDIYTQPRTFGHGGKS